MRVYSKTEMQLAVAQSISVSEVIRRLGFPVTGGRHQHIKSLIKRFGISTAHFLGSRANRGPNHRGGPNKLHWKEVLVFNRHNGDRTRAQNLRRALVESGREYKCEVCGIADVWNSKPLVLEVDHRDGVTYDCRPENVQFICPNCHSQRPRKRQPNPPKMKLRMGRLKAKLIKPCAHCGTPTTRPRFCSYTCSHAGSQKFQRPTREQLQSTIDSKPITHIAKEYGVGETAIRKLCHELGVQTKPRGYWNRQFARVVHRE